MDVTQVMALAAAGFILPFVQEKLAGARIEGAAAIWINFAACVVIALGATIASGGLGGGTVADPVAFTTFLLGKAAGVFALAQIVFKTAPGAVARVGGTA